MSYLVFRNIEYLEGAGKNSPGSRAQRLVMQEFSAESDALNYLQKNGGYIVQSLDLSSSNPQAPPIRPKPNPGTRIPTGL